MVIFTLEFAFRQYLYIREERNTEFWTDPLNVIDFIAILPSYIELVQWIILGFPKYGPPDQLFLKLMKLAKCTRVFKLMKHFNGTEVLKQTIIVAMEALSIPFFFLGIFVLLFASIMFFIEGQSGEFNEADGHYYSGGESMTFLNIPHTMYFMMVTMTTTGYGDQYPSSSLGKVLAAVAAIFGILFLAMPLTIVGNSFYNNWNKFLAKKEMENKKKEMLERRKEYKRRTLLQVDLRRNVEKLLIQHTEPGPPSRRMDGTQRDILGAYLTLMHLVSTFRQALSNMLSEKNDLDKLKKKEKEAATGTGTEREGDGAAATNPDAPADNELKYQEELQEEKDRDRIKHLNDMMLDMSVNSAVFGSVLSKGTKTQGRKGSKRLLRDISRRILVQVKMKKWASLYGRHPSVGLNADIAERHKVR